VEAAQGNAFIIAKAGKPMVKVLPLSAEGMVLVTCDATVSQYRESVLAV
jgi:hypothetical protein